MLEKLFGWLSPGGKRGRHQVLLFHRVLPENDSLLRGDPDREAFDSLIGYLNEHATILPLPEAIARARSGSLPPASLSITFDDGYADNATVALPVLRKHGVSATFFVATAYLDGGRMWNDTVIEAIRRCPDGQLDLSDCGLGRHLLTAENRFTVIDGLISTIKHRDMSERQSLADEIGSRSRDLPDDLMMTGPQVRELAAAGMTIGAHTHSHPILTRLEDDEARRDIAHGREVLNSLTGDKIELFAYPNGKPGQDYDARHVRMVREMGFAAAVSTAPGVTTATSDYWQLPRFTPWDQDHGRFLLRLLMNRHGLI